LQERGEGRQAPADVPARRPPVVLGLAGGLVAALTLLPLVYLVLRVAGAGEATIEALVRWRTVELLLRTTVFAAVVTGLAMVVGVPLAWLTARSDLPARAAWSVLLALPLVIPTYVGGYVFIAALGPRGLLQQSLAPLGVTRLPELYGFGGATAVLTAFTYPYIYLSTRAALARMDASLEESARSLGRTGWESFRDVVLPQLRPALTAGGLLVALYALSDFGAVALLQLETFTRVIYVQYQGSFDRTSAAALALLLALLTATILSVEVRARGRARYHRSTGGVARVGRPVPLGRWRWPALLLCGSVVGLALVLPIGVLLYWLLRGVGQGLRLGILGEAIVGSVQGSGLAALAALACALPIALLAVRFPGRTTAAIERLSYIGYGLPGIVIALSLVFFGARLVPALYQTLGMLVLAYVVRFLPQAIGALRASLLQVGPHVEEAARSLGRGPFETWRDVTLPLVLPGVLSGAAIVFLTTMKELPATLLLAPIGFRTLATLTWSAASEGLFAEAALPALLLVLCSAPALFVLLGRSEEMAERSE
jgi:iron(III) transport system permease protein